MTFAKSLRKREANIVFLGENNQFDKFPRFLICSY